jgi:hypothetical protein
MTALHADDESLHVSFNFNKVYVIESSRPDDELTGKEVFTSAIRPRTYQGILEAEYVYVINEIELYELLTRIEADVANKLQLPFIHFEMHGNTEGIELEQALVSWKELTEYLRAINVATRNNLMLSFATCYGNEIHRLIDFSDRAPFFGFIAPVASVSFPTIKSGFDAFFNVLFTGGGVIEAHKALNNECSGDEYFVLDNSEYAFTRPLKKQIAELQNPVTYAKFVLNSASEMLLFPNLSRLHNGAELIELAKETTNQVLLDLIADLDFFLMRDLPPHQMNPVN